MKVWWCIVQDRRETPSYCRDAANPDHDYCKWQDREVSLKEIEGVLARNGIRESGIEIKKKS